MFETIVIIIFNVIAAALIAFGISGMFFKSVNALITGTAFVSSKISTVFLVQDHVIEWVGFARVVVEYTSAILFSFVFLHFFGASVELMVLLAQALLAIGVLALVLSITEFFFSSAQEEVFFA